MKHATLVALSGIIDSFGGQIIELHDEGSGVGITAVVTSGDRHIHVSTGHSIELLDQLNTNPAVEEHIRKTIDLCIQQAHKEETKTKGAK